MNQKHTTMGQKHKATMTKEKDRSWRIPREEWDAHPHFPAQTLLMGSHENFRRNSRYIIELVAQKGDLGLARLLYWQWMMAMRGHEHYEESKLYPYLARRYGLSMDFLSEEHEALHTSQHAVEEALTQGAGTLGARASQAEIELALEALRAYDALLVAHLRAEEDTVIPLLLSLRPEEFEEYTSNHIETLLARLASSGEHTS